MSRIVPLLVLCAVLFTILVVPLKITGYGYLPVDDALRHAGKAVSGKDWNEILVLREDVTMDSHPGWHAILGAFHRLASCNADSLVVFSVIALFILFCIIPAIFLRRPEAWLITLLAISVLNPGLLIRLFLGRPFIFSMSSVAVLCLLWPRLRDKKVPYGTMIVLTAFFALSTWIHGSWHLFGLPVLCFFLAREWRAALRLTACAVLGIAIGALLTGHPYLFLREALLHTIRAFGSHTLQRMLVTEFRASNGNSLLVFAVVGMLGWRAMRGAWDRKTIDNPVFILAIFGWVLGFISVRFWMDWGLVALYVWMALEFSDGLKGRINFFSPGRVVLTLAVACTFYLSITSDLGSRWTRNLTKEYLSLDEPSQREWLPEPGGTVYTASMDIFYDTFFKNPRAPWRYILGFEPTIMPPEDLAIFRKIQWNFGAAESYRPWVEKMKPEDRLIVRGAKGSKPGVPGLEWHYAATKTWIGRLPGGS